MGFGLSTGTCVQVPHIKKNMLPACMFLSDEFCATCAEGAVVLAAT